MNAPPIKHILECALLASAEPLAMADFRRLADYEDDDITAALAALREEWQTRGFRLVEVADGWQFISGDGYMEYLRRLRPQKTARLSRQLMEVLAIIAYRQPTTRGDIEQIRGVSVSSVQLAALEELGWIEEVGRRETPGRPVLFGTTKTFLNDLALSSLDELPELAQEEINAEFEENDAAADSKNGADAGQLAAGLSTAQTPHDDSVDNGGNNSPADSADNSADNGNDNSPADSADDSVNNGDNNSAADSVDDSVNNGDDNSTADSTDNFADNGDNNSAADSADNSADNGGDNSVADSADNSADNGDNNSAADSADDSADNGDDNSVADSADDSVDNGDNNSAADSADDSANNGGDNSAADSADNSANNGDNNSVADSVDDSANNSDDSTGDGGRL